MKKLQVIDMTLRQTANTGSREMTFKDKLEIARILDRLKVDAIELAPITGSKAEQLTNRTVASMVSARVSAAVEVSAGNIEETWDSIRNAKEPSLNLLVPVSTVLMEYTCHKKAPAMLSEAAEMVGRARFHCEHVEISLVDATRAEKDFLCEMIRSAIKAGADRVTVCDTAGVMLPDEFGAFIAGIRSRVPELEGLEFCVQISDEISMALSCAAAAVREGVTGIKCTAVKCGFPALEEAARFIRAKGADIGISCSLRDTEINRAVSQIARILAPAEETGHFSALAQEETSGICLDINDTAADIIRVAHQLGYELSEEDGARVYEAFRRVAEKKHFVGARELDAIIASAAMQVPPTYKVLSYVINSGNVITATANILLEKDGAQVRGVAIGDGPIDAAFQAIEQIIGHHYELDDFQIQTVTEGRDAMGSALVKLRSGGRVYSGNGISTDIIGASIRAYVSALNKIVYELN